MPIYQPFTYLIGWSTTKMFYYGARYARNTNPSELWTTYFTSSAKVTAYRKQHGEPDIRVIRKVFKTAKDTRRWESLVLRKIKAKSRQDFLNQTEAPSFPIFDRPHTEETKRKISLSLTGKSPSEETRNRLSAAGLGRIVSVETGKKISAAKKGKPHSQRHCENIGKAQLGKRRGPMKEETKDKIRKLRADRKLIQALQECGSA